MNSSDAILLEHFGGTVNVASFRAVQAPAVFNQLVLTVFGLLFTPAVARLFARKDREGINNLYWQTAIWMAIISFPIFAVTFSLARPITLVLYGQRYSDSALILALLSLGYYFNTATGNNGMTLKVFGKLRYIVIVNILAAAINLCINLLLIPRYGALGAAFGTAGTMIVHNILKQAGLGLGTGIAIFNRDYVRVYLSIVVAALVLLLVQMLMSLDFYVSFTLAAIVSLAVVGLNRKSLRVGEMFPELLRMPLVRRIFGE